MSDECEDCYRCIAHKPNPDMPGYTLGMSRFIVCVTCGNKRCPKATDHALACTGSNEVGQKGSRWEDVSLPPVPFS